MGVSVTDRLEVVKQLDAWIVDFRQAALDAVDGGCNVPDMLRIAQLIADSKANRRALERQKLAAPLELPRPIFSRN